MNDSQEKNPNHYTTGRIEVFEFIADQKLNFALGNAVKYACRANHKGNKKSDLKKAIVYLILELEQLEDSPRPPKEVLAQWPL